MNRQASWCVGIPSGLAVTACSVRRPQNDAGNTGQWNTRENTQGVAMEQKRKKEK